MIGQTLGHYRIVAKMGAGGMGEVYSARDERLERDVALKILPAGLLADEAARKRFRKEALALSKLNHPNIATIYDFDTDSGVDFLAMEYVLGGTLADRIANGALLEKTARISCEVGRLVFRRPTRSAQFNNRLWSIAQNDRASEPKHNPTPAMFALGRVMSPSR